MFVLTCSTELAIYVNNIAAKLPKGRAFLNTSENKNNNFMFYTILSFLLIFEALNNL